MARAWADLVPALRDHPEASSFVPVASHSPHGSGSVPVFPLMRDRWAQAHALPRGLALRTEYATRAVALLEEHWPLEGDESPNLERAGVGALRFVIYFAERNIPPERYHEFVLADHMLEFMRTLVRTSREDCKWDLSFDFARKTVAKRMLDIGPRPVLRYVLRGLQTDEPRVGAAFRLNLMLHDTLHVLSACDLALVPLRVLRKDRARGSGIVTTTVRVAWPGLVEADEWLHLLFNATSPLYARTGSALFLRQPKSDSGRGETKSEPGLVASFNVAAMETVCRSEDLLRDARAHHAPPLLPPPPPLPSGPLLLDEILPSSPVLPTSARGELFLDGILPSSPERLPDAFEFDTL